LTPFILAENKVRQIFSRKFVYGKRKTFKKELQTYLNFTRSFLLPHIFALQKLPLKDCEAIYHIPPPYLPFGTLKFHAQNKTLQIIIFST